MQTKTKDAFEVLRRWIVVICTVATSGGLAFMIWAGEAKIKQVGFQNFVSKTEYERDLDAAVKLKAAEKENVVDRLSRIEADVREIKTWVVPARSGGARYPTNALGYVAPP